MPQPQLASWNELHTSIRALCRLTLTADLGYTPFNKRDLLGQAQ